MRLGYMAVDQYGYTYHGLKRPRRDLLAELGRKSARRMYVDSKKTGRPKHIGYVIAGLWLRIYEVHDWNGNGSGS